MAKLMIRETYVNENTGWAYGETEWYEPFTSNLGQLFRYLQKEYGRASCMYMDGLDGDSFKIGWVFTKRTKRTKYTDSDNTYVSTVWIQYKRVIDDQKEGNGG